MAEPRPPEPALEREERARRREATRRSIQRNASQARGELERGNPDEVLRITAIMLRGRDIRTMSEPQVPLVYYRGRAFEALGDTESAMACYRVLAAWDGGAHPVVDDARGYIDEGLQRLIALTGEPPGEDAPRRAAIPPERDRRVFPAPVLTVARIILAVVATMAMTVVAAILLAIFT